MNTGDDSRRPAIKSTASGEEALLFEAVVEVSDELAVAVPFERGPPLVGAEHSLARLAPARMRHLGVDVRPEAVLAALHGFPERYRPLLGKREMDDRLDRFEPVLPRQYQAQRRPVPLGHRFAVHPGHQKGELVAGLGDSDALDIGPGVPELL